MTETRQFSFTLLLVGGAVALVALRPFLLADTSDRLSRAGEFYEAQQYEETLGVLRSMPHDGAAEFLAGKATFRLGRYKEAEEFFRRALATDPSSARFAMDLALSLYKEGKKDDADACYRNVAEKYGTTDPDLAEKAAIARRAAGKQPTTP